MKRIAALVLMAAFLSVALVPTVDAQVKDKPAKDKLVKDKAKKPIKKILEKLDPEIRAAVVALNNAKAKLKIAISDEVFTEKSGVQGKVIDKLKAASAAVDRAIALTQEAQKIDDGKE